MPLTLAETPLYYKDAQGNYHRILSGADMTGYRTAAAQDEIDAGLVSAAAAQTLTDSQQAKARNNIGAIAAGSIATIESSPATQAHAVGDYIVYNGQLYKVTAAIAHGESLTVGTNVESTTVSAQLPNLIFKKSTAIIGATFAAYETKDVVLTDITIPDDAPNFIVQANLSAGYLRNAWVLNNKQIVLTIQNMYDSAHTQANWTFVNILFTR